MLPSATRCSRSAPAARVRPSLDTIIAKDVCRIQPGMSLSGSAKSATPDLLPRRCLVGYRPHRPRGADKGLLLCGAPPGPFAALFRSRDRSRFERARTDRGAKGRWARCCRLDGLEEAYRGRLVGLRRRWP